MTSTADKCLPCTIANCSICASKTRCSQCQPTYFVQRDDYGNSNCVIDCKAGTIKSVQMNNYNTCENCPYGCASCPDTKTCGPCDADKPMRYKNTNSYESCVAFCPEYTFSTESNTCTNCLDNCLECSSATKCKTCGEGSTLVPGTGVEPDKCVRCINGCKVCGTTSTKCMTCING